MNRVMKFLTPQFFALVPLFGYLFRRLLRPWLRPNTKVGVDITAQGVRLVELTWQRNSPFHYWSFLYFIYRNACGFRNSLNNCCLKVTGHYMSPRKLALRPKDSAKGFWQITSLLHLPVEQGVMLNGEIAQPDRLANAMEKIIQAAKGSVKEVSLPLDTHLVFQIPLGPVAHYFGVSWEANFDPLPKKPWTLVLQDSHAIELTQQLISQQDIELPLPIHQIFLMYVVDPGNGGNEGSAKKAAKKEQDTVADALVLVGCPRREVSSREQLLTRLRLHLHTLEPRINAALRAIGFIDPALRLRLIGQVWIWISLDNSLASVQLVSSDRRSEGQAELNADALAGYLNYCVGWAGAALQDIVASYSGVPMAAFVKEVKEIACPLDIRIHLVNPLQVSALSKPANEAAESILDEATLEEVIADEAIVDEAIVHKVSVDKAIGQKAMQPDWLVALGLASGLIDNSGHLHFPDMYADSTQKISYRESASV